MSAGPGHFAVLSAIVFGIGLYGVLSRPSTLGVATSLLVLLTAPVIALVGFAHTGHGSSVPPTGDALAVFAVVASGVEALVAVALAMLLWRRTATAEVDEVDIIAGAVPPDS